MIQRKSLWIISFGLWLIALPVGAQQVAVTPTESIVQPNSGTENDRYRLGPGDVIDIRVYSRPNLSRENVRIEGNGMFRMPLIETDIQAACKTEGELAKEISQRYLKFYKNLQVDVFVLGLQLLDKSVEAAAGFRRKLVAVHGELHRFVGQDLLVEELPFR